jgi:hypothetical protein
MWTNEKAAWNFKELNWAKQLESKALITQIREKLVPCFSCTIPLGPTSYRGKVVKKQCWSCSEAKELSRDFSIHEMLRRFIWGYWRPLKAPYTVIVGPLAVWGYLSSCLFSSQLFQSSLNLWASSNLPITFLNFKKSSL